MCLGYALKDIISLDSDITLNPPCSCKILTDSSFSILVGIIDSKRITVDLYIYRIKDI